MSVAAQGMRLDAGRLSRRALVRALGAGAGAAVLGSVPRAAASPRAAQGTGATPGVVRLGAVNTPEYSGLLDDLLADFEAQSGLRVPVASGEDVYLRAREGAFDLIISHYGHRDVEAFMSEGLGQWPRTVFANQVALVGPPADPAGVRGLADATEAFRRVAEHQAPWIVNNLPGIGYLEAVLWEGAGQPLRGEWYLNPGLAEAAAVRAAADHGAYTLWGIFPFLRLLAATPLALEPLVLADSLLQRIMVSVVVRPEHFPQANVEGAAALQQYLLTPAVQARIRGYRVPGREEQLWWPAARHNFPGVLPGGGGGGGGGGGR